MAEAVRVHSAAGERRLRRRDGGRSRAGPAGFRGGRGAGLQGRDVAATDEGDTGSKAGAARIAARLEIPYTPKHGSGLNRAEIEIGAMARPCLNRRSPDRGTMGREMEAWAERRNGEGATVDGRFTTEDARMKLRSLYLSTQ